MKKSVIVLLAAPILAHATLTPHLPGRGAEKIQLDRGELCYIPNRLEGSKFSKKDLERERDLCGMHINTTHAVCGKTESTNPALEFFEIGAGWTVEQMQAKNCFVQKPGGSAGDNAFKKLAKYKLSTSCSYTPSLLAYYQVSRFLGNINQVPPAVLRTVEQSTHLNIGTKAEATIKDKSSLIAQTWAGLLSMLNKKQAHAKATNVFTDDYAYSFGALQMNPSKEEKYSELFHGGSDQPARTANFKAKNASYKRLTDSRPLSSMGLGQWSAANAQEVLKMQNIADMIILDTMLSQQDRFGNLHYTVEPYARVNDKGVIKVDKLDSLSKQELASGKAYPAGTVMLKRLMMKDNDCGVSKMNHLKNGALLEGISHMNPETFEKLLKLYKLMNTDVGVGFFRRETAMNSTDIATFKANITHVINILINKCSANALHLDLDLDSAFAGQAVPNCKAIVDANK